jgi:hypothetical protein
MYAEALISRVNKKWSIEELGLVGFSESEKLKHRTAQRMLETVVNSWEFRQELLATVFTNTAGQTNAKIYNVIINGAEILSPETDYQADINVNAYRKRSVVIGFTYDYTEKTWLNLNFFDGFDYSDIAGNLFHEWLHKLGFGHRSASEKTSVPYAAGYLVRKLVKHLMNGGILHDVNQADKEIDVILGSTIPSKPLEPYLVCKRIWWKPWQKHCSYENH